MTDSTKVAGSIEVDSHARVAYDLMDRIARVEGSSEQMRTRDYWLKLYAVCNAATQGVHPDSLLKMPR